MLMFIDFFINGSGHQSEINYEKYKYVWVGIFVFFGLVQLLLISKYFKLNKFKYLLLIVVLWNYIFISYRYF